MKDFRITIFIVCAVFWGTSELANAACDKILNPGANVASVVAAAAAGSTICLNSGAYGFVDINSFTKSPRVTLTSVTPLGASMQLRLYSDVNGLTVDGINFTGGLIIGASGTSDGANNRNITIQNSAFGTARLDIITIDFNNNNILIDHNTFGAHDVSGGTCEGRVCVTWGGGPGSVPAGVVVRNNTFGPGGCSDGIQVGSYGVVIGPGNMFTGIVQSGCSAHVDAIQGYGQSHTTITGNYFINNTVDLGFYDGGTAEIVTNNVIQHASWNSHSVQMGTISNPLFEHNTVVNAQIAYNGKVELGPSVNLLMRNNIFTGSANVTLNQGHTLYCTDCVVTHNMFENNEYGTDNIIGLPTFIGSTTPTTWTGYQLASASLGKNAGSNGKDMGTRYYGSVTKIQAPKNLQTLP